MNQCLCKAFKGTAKARLGLRMTQGSLTHGERLLSRSVQVSPNPNERMDSVHISDDRVSGAKALPGVCSKRRGQPICARVYLRISASACAGAREGTFPPAPYRSERGEFPQLFPTFPRNMFPSFFLIL